MIQDGLNRKSDNLAVKLLSHMAMKDDISPNFRTLRLQGCEIGKLGIKHLRTILKMPHSSIEEIDLCYNMVQSDGV